MNLSHYGIIDKIGEGGMASVYSAEDKKFDTTVAIKVLNKELCGNENIRKRFLAEAKSLYKMSHANIVKVTDLIEDADTVAFVMEYIDGETLKQYIEKRGKLANEEIKDLFSQMLDAVGYVHEQKMVHRDIKPSNFMIDKKGKVKLMDFGIAKTLDLNSAEYTQTGTGIQMGTPIYMSPEQITETKSVTAQSDIYSLGVVLWQMVTSKRPYEGDSMSTFQIQLRIVQNQLDLTNSAWDTLIQKATKKQEEDRYESCFLFQKEINQNQISNSSQINSCLTIIDKPNNSDQTIIEINPNSDVLLRASLLDNKNDEFKYGFVDIKGNWIIQPKFDTLGNFDKEGFCAASFNGKMGFINRKGDWIIFPNYYGVYDFDEKGYCKAHEDKEFGTKLGYINRKGNWEIEPLFFDLSDFDEKDFCRATIDGENWGFINRQMEWLINPKFERIDNDFDDSDYCCVKSKNFWGFSKSKWGLINRNGDWIIKPKFDHLFCSNHKDYYTATINGKTGIINSFGNWIVQPLFDGLSSFDSKGFCTAHLNGKCGSIDLNGYWLIPPIFNQILFWDLKDYGAACKKGKWGFINRQGDWIIKPISKDSMVFYDDYCITEFKKKFGVINRNGDWVLEPNYYYLENFSDEFNVIFKAALNKQNYGFINKNGDWLIDPIFDLEPW